jgi:hypothetical protein
MPGLQNCLLDRHMNITQDNTSVSDSSPTAPQAKSDVHDPINPHHYTGHPSGVDCADITEHFSFCLGNVIKYVWRAGLKSKDRIEDLRKARWYLDREITRLEQESK